ncbi:FkbM family methyltransferase [Mucilaginibacter sp.]|uniref:FkbM family methyltransferase n=1 Tax=Mucilaginibacter sp. TaxID=1882438 RepID=UPI003D107E22
MRSSLKKAIGPKVITQLRTWFPSAVQKRSELREIERKAVFYSSFIKKGDTCFDVGANVGNRIAPLLYIGAKVVAVEPQEKCAKFLKQKFGNQITLIRKGLGEAKSVKEFHISNDSTISSFSDEWINAVKDTHRFKEKNWNKAVMIEMTTADEVIEANGIPSFIKIDVEGYELEVLKGLTQPIGLISFEYTVPEQPDRAIMCLNQIEKHNKNIECNYSIGEDLVWALTDWLSAEEMRNHIFSEGFNQTSFGDIYIRTKQA